MLADLAGIGYRQEEIQVDFHVSWPNEDKDMLLWHATPLLRVASSKKFAVFFFFIWLIWLTSKPTMNFLTTQPPTKF